MIDARQSYLQDVVVAGLRALGFDEQAEQSIHFSYEMVALSPRCCADLGIELSEEDAQEALRRSLRPQGSRREGRRSDGQADRDARWPKWLRAMPEDNRAAQRAVATEIAMGALRYFLLKFTRNTVIAFDFQEALSFEGETGPYVQYAAVRARNILRKLEERGEIRAGFRGRADARCDGAAAGSGGFVADSAGGVESRFGGGARGHCGRAGARGEVCVSAGADVQQLLSSVPGACRKRIRSKKVFLLWMTDFFRKQLERTAGILGIKVPAYM